MSRLITNTRSTTPANPLSGTVLQYTLTADQIMRLLLNDATAPGQPFNNVQQSSIVTPSSAIANSDTKISSGLYVPANTLTAGTLIRFTVLGTCTSSAGGAGVFTIRYGTGNVVADGSIGTLTFTAQTSGSAIPFKLTIDITHRVIGASGTIYGYGTLVNQGTIGIYTLATGVFVITPATFASNAAGYLNLSYISGNANTATTFQQVITEIIKV
jgi:hypothetical protein